MEERRERKKRRKNCEEEKAIVATLKVFGEMRVRKGARCLLEHQQREQVGRKESRERKAEVCLVTGIYHEIATETACTDTRP